MGLFAASAQQDDLATICFATAGAIAGFLIFNVPGGRIFLGDAGSVPLGFLGAAISLIGIQRDIWPPSLPLLLFMPLYTDALLTLARRLLRGERIWEAHREHAYQRLVQSGWPHHRVAAVYAMATLATAVLGAASTGWNRPAQLTMLLSCALVLFLLLSAIHQRCRFRQDTVSPK
jgi:UDP-N-acetylmuramyl pentapeptide phosphotransferase/UDP-N-acetylglucosamine-1-phosphate transferase